jgi:hypothetical protein
MQAWHFIVAGVVLVPLAVLAYLVLSIHRGDNQ